MKEGLVQDLAMEWLSLDTEMKKLALEIYSNGRLGTGFDNVKAGTGNINGGADTTHLYRHGQVAHFLCPVGFGPPYSRR